MKQRFTDEQIFQIPKKQESGDRAADVFRRPGISWATFCKYKSKYGGVELPTRNGKAENSNSKWANLQGAEQSGIDYQNSSNRAAGLQEHFLALGKALHAARPACLLPVRDTVKLNL